MEFAGGAGEGLVENGVRYVGVGQGALVEGESVA